MAWFQLSMCLNAFLGRGQNDLRPAGRTLNPHGSKDISEGSVEVNLNPETWIESELHFPLIGQTSPMEETEIYGIFHRWRFAQLGPSQIPAWLWLSELQLKLVPKTLAGCHSLRMCSFIKYETCCKTDLTWPK